MLPQLSNNTQNHGLYKTFAETLSENYTFEIRKRQNLGVRYVFYDKINHALIISYANTNRVHVLDLSTSKLRFFDFHGSTVRHIDVTKNGEEIVTASWDGSACLTSYYDLKLRLRLTTRDSGRSPHAAVSDGYIFTYTYDSDKNVERISNTVRQYCLASGTLENTFMLNGSHLGTRRCGSCIEHNGLLFAVSDTGYLEVYNIKTGELLVHNVFKDLLQTICIFPEYNMLVCAGDEGFLYLVEASSGRIITKKIGVHLYYISQLIRHPSKTNVFFSVSWDGTCKAWRLSVEKSIWKLPTLELIGTANVKGETSLWSATIINDLLVCGGERSDIQIFDIQNMAEPIFKGKLVLSADSFALLSDSNTFYTNDLSTKMVQVTNKDKSPINDSKLAEYVLRANNNFKFFKDLFSSEDKKRKELENNSFGYLQITK